MYIYHRTRKTNAKSIKENGFVLKNNGAKRIESGNGIYTVSNLEDANKPYNKKTYGNYIVRFDVCESSEWEQTTKIKAMKDTKAGIHKNRIYPVAGIGEVAVLCDISKINNIEISRDNGKSWN